MGSMINSYSGAGHFANDSNYEVQRSNHYEISIDLEALNLPEDQNAGHQEAIRLCCTQAGIPQIQINPQQLRHGNETINVAGSPQWNTSSITVYDTIGKSMANILQDWFFRIFNPDTHTMGLVTNYKTTATLFLYSPDASVIRSWTLYGVFPTSLNFGDLSAEQQGTPLTIRMDLAVDKAVLTKIQ